MQASAFRQWLTIAAALIMLICGAGDRAFAACTYGSCAPSNLIINGVVTSQAASQLTDLISDQINQTINGMGGNQSFASAGGANAGPSLAYANGGHNGAGSTSHSWRLWAGTADNWLRDTQSNAGYNGTIFTGAGGIHFVAADRLLFGVSAGYERINIDTSFNNGKLTSDGLAVALYGGYALSSIFSIDGTIGRAWIDYGESHGGITGSFSGDRWFGALDLNAKTAINQWRMSTSLGYFGVSETQSAYTESNANPVANTTVYLNQIRAKARVGYEIMTGWGTLTPYASTRLDFDVSRSAAPVINSLGQTASTGNFDTVFGLGAEATLGANATLQIEGTTTEFRSDFRSYVIKGNVRVRF